MRARVRGYKTWEYDWGPKTGDPRLGTRNGGDETGDGAAQTRYAARLTLAAPVPRPAPPPGGVALCSGRRRFLAASAVARDAKLVEKHMAAAGSGNIVVGWTQIGGGPAMNEALRADAIDFASGGLPATVLLWEKTKGTQHEVRARAAMASIP